MCFYNDDYDWYADVHEESDLESGPACKCDECGREIASDQWRHTVFQQESELCQFCEDDCSGNYIGSEDDVAELIEDGRAEEAAELQRKIDNCQHSYGETFHYVRCRDCDNLLKAVERTEELAGCPVDSRRPALTELREALHETHDGGRYRAMALEMFPELASHRFLKID